MRRLLPILLLIALLVGCSTPFDAPSVPAGGAPPAGGVTPVAVPADAAAPVLTAVQTDAGGAGGDPVRISFAAWEYERPVYEGLARSFMAQNPGINVVIVPLEDLTNSQNQTGAEPPLVQLRRVVAGADTASALFVRPDAYGSTLLYNLKPLMDADSSFQRDDFYPGTLERYSVKDGVWVLPRYVYAHLLDYNKDLFKQNNLPEPKPGWTWDDLLATAEQLAKKNGGSVSTYGYFDWSNGFAPLLAILEAQGVDLTSANVQQAQLDRPEVVAAIKRVRDLTRRGALFQTDNTPNAPPADLPQLIQDGRVGIWQSDVLPGGAGDSANAAPSFAVGKVPYPTMKTPVADGSGGADGYIISGGTAHPSESWRWIEFLSRRQTDQPGASGADAHDNRIPARKSLAEQTGFWQSMDAATTAAYQAALNAPPAAPRAAVDPTTTGILVSALQQALFQLLADPLADPQQVLAQAQKDVQMQIAQIQRTPQPTPDTGPLIVATPEAQTAPAGATTITFSAVGYNTPDLRRMARAFRQQHADIFVQIGATDTLTGSFGLQELAQVNDCFAWSSPPQTSADYAALLNLQPLMDADATFPKNDFPAAVRAPYQHEGGLYGLPYAFSVRAVNYNRTLFDKTGVQPPTAAWKPDDFLQAAQALTSGSGSTKQYGYVPLSDGQQDLFFFVGQFGGRLTSGSGADARPTFDDPKLAEAIQWYLDLAKVHGVTPPLTFNYKSGAPGGEAQSYTLIQSGRGAMWLDYDGGTFGSSADSAAGNAAPTPGQGSGAPLSFEVGGAPLPVGAAGLQPSDLSSRGFQIAARSQHQQACWEWIKYMSQDASALNGDLPARASVAASEAFMKQAAPSQVALYQSYADALKRAVASGASQFSFYDLDPYWFFKAVSAASSGETDLRAGLGAAQKLTTAYAECMAQEHKPATCAKRVDPTYQGFTTEDPQPASAP